MSTDITAWRPSVHGIREVFHASFTDHAYPAHTHDAWTLLIVDAGAVRYELDHHEHGAVQSHVTLLPPHVPHDGRSAVPTGFRKRVLYLESDVLGEDLIGAAVDTPALADPLLRRRVHQLHDALVPRTEDLESESRLALITERLRHHFERGDPLVRRDPRLADRFRQLLDARVPETITLDEASKLLHVAPTHLVRAFSQEYGMPPHRYLTGRRVDLARRHLLAGHPLAEVATLSGFYDQSHLTRHFRRMLGVSPGRYAR